MGHLIWDRKRDGGFPDVKLLKQLVRDHAAPDGTLAMSIARHLEQASRANPPLPLPAPRGILE
jgi:selenoprotein W-related protein